MAKALPKLPGRGEPARRATRPPGAVFGELADDGRLRIVALDAIEPNPRQPRTGFDAESLQRLADSISARGVLQPPVVRATSDGGYQIIAGERRCRAARLAGLTEIDVLVKDTDDRGQLEDALLENTARLDLTPVEEARAYAALIEDLGVTREEIGRRVGRSRVSVSNHLRLLDLPDEALELLDRRELTFAHGRSLLLCDDHQTRRTLARRAAQEHWSTRQLEDAARAAGAPRARRSPAKSTAEQLAAARHLQDAITSAAGVQATVTPAADDHYAVKLSRHDAIELARRLGATDPLAGL